MEVADLKPRGVKAPLQLVPAVLLELYASTLPASVGGAWAEVPTPLLECCAAAFADGAAKYAPWNWLHQGDITDMRETYTGALLRHVHALADGEDSATDSGVSHIGHAAACAVILAHHLGVQSEPDRKPSEVIGASTHRLMDDLVRAVHMFADPTRPDLDPSEAQHYLAVAVRCLGDLAVELDHGYTESYAAKYARDMAAGEASTS